MARQYKTVKMQILEDARRGVKRKQYKTIKMQQLEDEQKKITPLSDLSADERNELAAGVDRTEKRRLAEEKKRKREDREDRRERELRRRQEQRERELKARQAELRQLKTNVISDLRRQLGESVGRARGYQTAMDRDRRARLTGAEKTWQEQAGSIRDLLGATTGEAQGGLREALGDLRDLRQELRQAPSSVAEQARQIQDTQARQAIALAQAQGRGISGGDIALRDQLSDRAGDLISRTGAARATEYLARLGVQQQMLGQEAGLVKGIGDLGFRDLGVRIGLMDQEFNVSNLVQNQLNKGFGEVMALENFGLGGAIKLGGMDLGTALGIESLGSRTALGFGGLDLSGDRLSLSADQFSRQMDLSEAKFAEQKRQADKLWAYRREQEERARKAAFWKTLLSTGGTILGTIGGAILGGPAGAAVGGSVGKRVFGEIDPATGDQLATTFGDF